jgi:CheY-like chemotaxis protein
MMPAMTGQEFRRVQLGDPSLADIPTVVITGCAAGQIVPSEPQAADYLQKPVTRAHLLNVVAKHCEPMTD